MGKLKDTLIEMGIDPEKAASFKETAKDTYVLRNGSGELEISYFGNDTVAHTVEPVPFGPDYTQIGIIGTEEAYVRDPEGFMAISMADFLETAQAIAADSFCRG